MRAVVKIKGNSKGVVGLGLVMAGVFAASLCYLSLQKMFLTDREGAAMLILIIDGIIVLKSKKLLETLLIVIIVTCILLQLLPSTAVVEEVLTETQGGEAR